MASIFLLHWVTMWLGFLTELYSRPKVYADVQPHKRQIIDQAEWEGDRAVPRKGEKIEGQLFRNYTRRMFPHILGIFPFVTAWVIIINHIECSKADLRVERPNVRIPEWVNGAVRSRGSHFFC